MEALFTADNMIALATLTALEVVLGVDNVIFISILAGKLPAAQQARARRVGLLAAMIMRILLLFSLAWIVRLTEPLFTVFGRGVSGRDLILLGGGTKKRQQQDIDQAVTLWGDYQRRKASTRQGK